MSTPDFAIVIPARLHSTRFPGKALAPIHGRPLIEWVYERASRIGGAARVIVATDSDDIARVVSDIGGTVAMTSQSHPSGTDRVAEVAEKLVERYVVNLQGDEPIVPEGLVEKMVALVHATGADIVTACHPIRSVEQMEDKNNVKVVMDGRGRAVYFSRSPIPSLAGRTSSESGGIVNAYRHIGIYAFRRESLLRFFRAGPCSLEESEGLEQLRALENGMDVRLVISDEPTIGVDVPQHIKIVEKLLAGKYTPLDG